MNSLTIITGGPLHKIIEHDKTVKILLNEKKWDLLESDIADYKDDAYKPWYEQNIPHALSVTLAGVLLFISFCVTSTMILSLFEIDNTIFFNAFVFLTLALVLYMYPANKHIMNGDIKGVIIYRNILLISFILCVTASIAADLHGRTLFHLIITWVMLIFCRFLMNAPSFLDFVMYYRAINIINKMHPSDNS